MISSTGEFTTGVSTMMTMISSITVIKVYKGNIKGVCRRGAHREGTHREG